MAVFRRQHQGGSGQGHCLRFPVALARMTAKWFRICSCSTCTRAHQRVLQRGCAASYVIWAEHASLWRSVGIGWLTQALVTVAMYTICFFASGVCCLHVCHKAICWKPWRAGASRSPKCQPPFHGSHCWAPMPCGRLYHAPAATQVRGKDIPKPVRSWNQCGLATRVLDILRKAGFDKPLPIQAQALPVIMSGRDCIGIAKTGSGKTLAFVLPMLRHIKDQVGP